jgi:hypothetical protein
MWGSEVRTFVVQVMGGRLSVLTFYSVGSPDSRLGRRYANNVDAVDGYDTRVGGHSEVLGELKTIGFASQHPTGPGTALVGA